MNSREIKRTVLNGDERRRIRYMESWLRQHLSPNLRDSQRDVSEHRGSMAMDPYCKENEYLHRKVQEEGIHVGCLQSAAVAVLGGGTT